MFEKVMPLWWVEKKYVEAGGFMGDAVSYLYMGKVENFEELLADWEKWEKEYARRGFRTISLEDFSKYGGYGRSLNGLRKKREKGEKPIFHAQVYSKEKNNGG